MRAWIFVFLALVGCEDTRRARHRDRDRDDEPRGLRAEPAPVAVARARCAGPDCFPDVELTDTLGATYDRDSLDGNVVVVNFWASWSNPSLAEAPMLSRIHDRYPDVVVLGVAMDGQAPEIDDARRRAGMTYPAIPLADAARAFAIPDNLPTTWIYDRHGTRIEQNIGRYDEDDLIEVIERARATP